MKASNAAAGAAVLGTLAFLLWPRGGEDSGSKPPDGPPPSVIDPATAGVIRGTVRFEGKLPPPRWIDMSSNPDCHALHPERVQDDPVLVKGGLVQGAVVYVKSGLEKVVFAVPAEEVVIDQKACRFVPRVAAAMAGQTVAFVNSDSTKHNVKTDPKPTSSDGFNLVLQRQGTRRTVRVPKPELGIGLVCDYHSWMAGRLCILPHPKFRVTGEDGRFEISGLPPGDYTIAAWHEALGAEEAAVRVEPKGSAEAALTLPGR